MPYFSNFLMNRLLNVFLAVSAILAFGEDAVPLSIETALLGNYPEADVIAAVQAAKNLDLRSIPFTSVERLVNLSYWNVAHTLIMKSHEAHIDLTAPVRRAVGQMKHEAENLEKWLDPQYAIPQPTPMAARWAQNSSMVMLAARFAPTWGGIGANLAVFSNEKGHGHIDHNRTVAAVAKLLSVNITSHHISAEITAESGNNRKRYTLSVDVFDEIVPANSIWIVDFLRAQGSMQMSHGAEIPELHFFIRKRLESQWPRLSAAEVETFALWPDAPGVTQLLSADNSSEANPRSRSLRR